MAVKKTYLIFCEKKSLSLLALSKKTIIKIKIKETPKGIIGKEISKRKIIKIRIIKKTKLKNMLFKKVKLRKLS